MPLSLLQGATIGFSLGSPFMVLAIGLLGISTHCDRHGLGRYQLIGKARQHTTLDVVTTNGATVIAYLLAEMTETAVTVIDDDAIFAAAASTDEQADRRNAGRRRRFSCSARAAPPRGYTT